MARSTPPENDQPEWMGDNVREDEAALLRLRQLGFVEPSVLREAVQDGASAYRAADTAHHPAAYPGERMWGETCGSLAALTQKDGWEKDRIRGVDLVLNRPTNVAVIVTAGDAGTGRRNVSPNVRYRREQVITGLVNGSYDSLFEAGDRPEWDVWFLLHNVTGDRIVPAEVSRPRVVDRHGFVPSWIERLIIPTFVEGDGSTKRRQPSDLDQAGEPGLPADPVVNIQRRVS